MTAPWETNPIVDHVDAVDLVSAAGAPAPAEWTRLKSRYQDFLDLTTATPARDEVITAVISGVDDASIVQLRCLALAEAHVAAAASLNADVTAAVYTRLRELYAPAAHDNYAKTAKQFDDAAKRFVTAASTVDVESDPAVMVEQSDKVRRSWLDAEGFGNQLTRLLPAMSAAAGLAGIEGADQDSSLMPLCADLTDVHRRRAWLAWLKRDGRTGRWAALLKANATIRACRLDEHAPYAEPRPLEQRREPITGSTAVRIVEHDPEDELFVPVAINPKAST